jgi:asparagine synthase (glutamine-hydrolysing)
LKHEDAAAELRELLVAAARERMPNSSGSAVWMSGGWDSTAVFAAAQVAAKRHGRSRPVPVSISYPAGDPGREDELISAVADHWKADVHWLDIAGIPFFDREEDSSASRDEPYKHLYESWNASLAKGSRAVGARVALDGNGGDQLFQNTDVFLADLFREGKWLTLRREWPQRERGGFREMFSTVIQPNLGPGLLRVAKVLRRGRPLRHYLEREMPWWLNGDFVRRTNLRERDLASLTRPVCSSRAEREIDWFFTCLFVSRAFARLSSLALEQGVELRSPLSDRRVIEFALSRPWWERSSGKETKLLLRASMRGLLPDQVLAPRPHRTGITSGYSHGSMVRLLPGLVAELRKSPLVLEELGVLDSTSFYKAASAYVERGGNSFMRVNLFYTLHTELWLRAHLDAKAPLDAEALVPAGMA